MIEQNFFSHIVCTDEGTSYHFSDDQRLNIEPIDDQEICPHQIALTADGAHNPYRKFILPLAYEQIGLLYAVLGITSFHLGTVKKDRYLRDTLAVVYRLRAIRSLADTIQAGISGNIHDNERDALFATIQLLLLQDVGTY